MTEQNSGQADKQSDKRDFDAILTAFLHAERFSEAEEFLGGYLTNVDPEMREICLSLKADAIVTTGWDKLSVEVAKLADKKSISVVGLDLSSHVENPEDSNGWIEPGLETSYYSDEAFPFSTSGIDEILAVTGGGSTPWQGRFVDIGWAIEITGLAQLHSKIHEFEEEMDTSRGLDVAIGMSYLILNFHRSAVRDARAQGFPHAMPILLGEHDFGGPYIDSAYRIETVRDYLSEVEDAKRADKQAARQRVRKQAETLIDEMRERRQHVLDWPPRQNPDKRKTFVEYCESIERLRLSGQGISYSKHSWDMDDGECEELLAKVWQSFGLEVDTMPRKQQRETAFARLIGNRLFGRKGL